MAKEAGGGLARGAAAGADGDEADDRQTFGFQRTGGQCSFGRRLWLLPLLLRLLPFAGPGGVGRQIGPQYRRRMPLACGG
jgi:hypothetical protein